jgi:hypothetical protein
LPAPAFGVDPLCLFFFRFRANFIGTALDALDHESAPDFQNLKRTLSSLRQIHFMVSDH